MGHILGLHWNDVCAPWRILTPFAALARSGYEVSCGVIAEHPELDCETEMLVLHSPGNSATTRLIDQAKTAGIPVVADFDDAFFRHDRSRSADAVEEFRALLASVDAVTVSTELLALLYRQFNDNIRVLPNCYDETNPAWAPPTTRREWLQIGFAGSGFHDANLKLVVEALQTVLRLHPNVRVVEAGGPNLLQQLQADPSQLVYLGWQPFAGFPLLLREMDIVLAPLEDVPFNYGKSNVRCLTAGLVGAPVVASPVGAYAQYVEHGVNGYHATTQTDWIDALEQLIVDAELRCSMGEANRQRAQAFAIGARLWQWTDVYDRLLTGCTGARCS